MSKLCGVPPATLRAWERRYGVPAPARTASAYRLYGDEDIALISKMRDLVKGGMAAAEAAQTVLAEASRMPPPETHEDEDPFGDAADRIVDAVVRFDPEGLDKEVNRALGLGSAISIFENTLAPAMREIGNLWHEGTLTVAQEHLASHVIGGTVLHMLRLTQPVGQARRAVLACFADEDHTLGLYGIGLRFASWSFRTLLLGARTPPSAIARVVDSLDPDVVGLSATLVPPAANARELIDAYAEACRSTVWIVGGAGAQAMRPWIEAKGGIAATDDPVEVRKVLERALRNRKRIRSDEETQATDE
ncbi:MAG: B12-binding domain-containing protein [Polyangiaceae bacterium]|nr:B12-binding domain-containing protein [Polyangiaceae bacterium]